MPQSLLELAQQLTQARKPFVIATVIWCERPTSAKPGAQAIVQEDGQITGWVGGSCAQPVVIREAQRVLREGGDPYLLRLGAAEVGMQRADVRVFPMTCTSGGVLDIFIEPHLPAPQLILVGDSPIAVALSKLAAVLNFEVTQPHYADLGQLAINERTAILVATHGQYDEDALELALRSSAAYVGMVGSRRRADACRAYLRESGLSEAQIARLHAPAGLAIGAITPEEIAASILAELVQVHRRGPLVPDDTSQPVLEEARMTDEGIHQTAIDPVCGMKVEIATARHRTHHDEHDFYFCCPACKRLFERNPQEYFVGNEK